MKNEPFERYRYTFTKIPIEQSVILLIIFVETSITDCIVFISAVIMCVDATLANTSIMFNLVIIYLR